MADTHRADTEGTNEAHAATESGMALAGPRRAERWPVLIWAIALPKAAAERMLGAPWWLVAGLIGTGAALFMAILGVLWYAYDLVAGVAVDALRWENLRLMATVAGLSTLGFVVAVTALNLPYVDRSGPIWRSIGRSVRIAVVLWAPVILLTLVVGAVPIVVDSMATGMHYGVIRSDPGLVLAISVFISLLILLLLNALALRSVQDCPLDETEREPRCEFCGYSLVHQPEDARCPECGRPVRESLDARLVRPGSAWTCDPGIEGYFSSLVGVLFRPRSFYRDMQVHTSPCHDRGFAAVHYVSLMIAAAIACSLLVLSAMLRDGFWPFSQMTLGDVLEFAFGMLMIGVGCVCVSILGQRVLLLVVYIFWRANGTFAYRDAVTKIATYEVAFQWTYWIWLGLWMFSMMLFGTWLSDLLGLHRMNLWFSRFLIEETIIIAGLLGLTLLWIIRMQLAARTLRWANF